MGFIFDLDGTLLNSIADLGNAMNRVLEQHELPQHDLETYKTFVGNGIHKLVERSLPKGTENVDFYYEAYLKQYAEAYDDASFLYDGVLEGLKELNRLKIPIAIHTNKMQVFTDNIIHHFLDEIDFVRVVGDLRDGLHKPNPTHTLEIVDAMQCDTVYFVGDSDVDMKTALNANLIPVGVSWGFRSVQELEREGAQHMLSSFEDIFKLIQ